MRILIATLVLTLPLAGCLGDDGFDFEPGKGFTETGRTIELRMWVADNVGKEIYPGFRANLWAFCAAPLDPSDEASAAAIEYWPVLDTDGGTGAIEKPYDPQCSVPGPTLRVTQGDTVRVHFKNDHFHCHTIHWHGQYVPYESDGVQGVTQDSVCNGEAFTYEFVAERAGTLWYHCHVDVQFHVMQGLFGVIIVEPQDRTWEPKDIDREYVLVYSTLRRELVEATPERLANPHIDHQHSPGACGASGVPNCQNPPVDTSADTWLLNGHSLPHTLDATGEELTLANGELRSTGSLISLAPGERIRLRILNAGSTFEALHPHGHDMYVTHRDGNPINPEARVYVDTLSIGPAERYDVVLEGRAGAEGLWVFHTHVEHHVTNDHMAPGGAFTIITYPGFEDDLRPFAAELVGGLPYLPEIDIPDDVQDFDRRTVGRFGTDPTAVATTYTFPIDLACAVKYIRYTIDQETIFPGLEAQNSLQAVVRDSAGAEVASFAVPAQGTEWIANGTLLDTLIPGPMTVTISGQAFETTLDQSILVDYHATVEDVSAAGRLNACYAELGIR